MFEILLTFLFFFQPFERIPSLDLLGVSIRISSLVILSFWLLALIREPQLLKPKTLLDKAVIAFFFTGVLSAFFAEDLQRSLTVLLLWGFSLGAYLLVSRKTYRFGYEKLEKVLYISLGVTATFGFYQFIANSYFNLGSAYTLLSPNYLRDILGFARVQSVGLEPLYYATSLFLPLSLLAVRILKRGRVLGKHIALFSFGLTILILTLSRGAYLGILAGLVVIALCMVVKKQTSVKNATLLLSCMVIAWGAFQLLVGVAKYAPAAKDGGSGDVSSFINHAVGGEETRGASVNPRIDALKDAWSLYRQQPLTGVGIGNYGSVTTLQKTSENQQPIVNNQYLETLTETGPLGLLTLLSVIFLALRTLVVSLKSSRTMLMSIALLGTSVALGVQWNFFSTIYIILIWMILGLINSLSHAKD